MVFITVQNLVAIALVVLTIPKFNILRVWPENAYSCPLLAVLGAKIGGNGKFLNYYPSRNAIIRNSHHMKQTA